MIKFAISTITLTMLLIAGCDDAEYGDNYDSDPALGELDEPTSEFDEVSGEPVALNYEPAPLAALPDPAELEHASDEWSPGDTAQAALSDAYQDIWTGPTAQEVMLDLPSDRAMTGIGVRAVSHQITTLRVQGIRVSATGSLGDTLEYRSGALPNHELEVWCSAPPNYLITGVGGRIRDGNVTTLVVHYRRYNWVLRRLTGATQTKNCGSEPKANLEQRIVSWEHFSGSDLDRAVVNGVSMRELDDNLGSLRLRYRMLQ